MASEPTAREGLHIVQTAASVDAGGVTASFTLDGAPPPSWQGAFVRAFGGTLGDAAGRWRFEGPGIVVTRVRRGRAGDVATAVQAAVAEANTFLASRADAAEAASAAAVAADADAQRDSVEAGKALFSALGV
jgi:hypothetical protein